MRQRLRRPAAPRSFAQSELSPEKIASILTHVMNDPEKLARMAAAAKQAGKPDAANLLADMVEAIAARTYNCRVQGETRMKMPKAIGLVHFIGIGGIGMSGIAEVLP